MMEPLDEQLTISNLSIKKAAHNRGSKSNGIKTKTQTTESCYTSLRDLIAVTSPSSAPGSFTPPSSPSSRKSSWDDVPIKNQLVKQAALAYLQPMSTPPEIDHRSWVQKVKENLIRCILGDPDDDDVEVGCLGLLHQLLWTPIMDSVWRSRGHQH